MSKKQCKEIIILVIGIAIVALAATVYDSMLTTTMPMVESMRLDDAIGALEDAKIIENDYYISKIVILDEDNANQRLELEDFLDFQKYIVVKQTPEAGSKYKYRPGLFVKSGTTDLTVLTVRNAGTK